MRASIPAVVLLMTPGRHRCSVSGVDVSLAGGALIPTGCLCVGAGPVLVEAHPLGCHEGRRHLEPAELTAVLGVELPRALVASNPGNVAPVDEVAPVRGGNPAVLGGGGAFDAGPDNGWRRSDRVVVAPRPM